MREQRSPAYVRAVARSVGVPEFWVDDAAQDIALAVWKDGKQHDTTAIRREAIDAARRYGPFSRRRVPRPVFVRLDVLVNVPAPGGGGIDLRHLVARAFESLTSRQRSALKRRLARLPMSSLDSAHASAARRKIRRTLNGY